MILWQGHTCPKLPTSFMREQTLGSLGYGCVGFLLQPAKSTLVQARVFHMKTAPESTMLGAP